jgi:hypothetical protein
MTFRYPNDSYSSNWFGRNQSNDIGRGAGKLGQTVRQAMPGRQGEETRVPVGHHSSSSSSRI